ncbi:DUF1801 domain-containing protein [Pseudoxanthomonas gei]|uniref:DUF1801 domain-containing protein n=1 Tax=Pseudoxanthomonas gei TaxID=1383030 RepID=A0ABX0AA95_9GAMM|nr:DUF1801 domain-containing protein [Pseudoxanthomonas gei]NDK38465.1 DUF1801 domain-containing protein [Pseudoxanthomonas gei]
MAENKTRATDASVTAYLSAIADEERKRDCATIAEMMARITQAPARMWGTSIVGFDSYHYRYESGREGDAPVTGFSSRKSDISVYLSTGAPDQEALLARLGRHKMGKACLSIRKLADVDMDVLEQLVAGSVAEVRRRHG